MNKKVSYTHQYLSRTERTMKRHGATTYTLQAKAGISSSTIRRMQANESVSTNTLDTLCKFFNCELGDIVKFQPDEK